MKREVLRIKNKINSRKKGQRTCNKAIAILEENNWLVENVEKSGKYIKQKDLFGLFDLVAIKDKVKFIQVKTNSTKGYIKKLKWFRKDYDIKGLSYELWVWKDRKGFKIYKL